MIEMRRKTIPVIIGLLLLTAAFIFFMSSRDVDQSLNDSMGFDRLLAHWFVEGFDQMNPEEQLAAALRFDEPIRHVAHTLEFALLGFLLMALCLALGRKGWTGQGSTGPCYRQGRTEPSSGQDHASHGECDGRDVRHILSCRQALLITWAAGTSYGILDEIHQIFVNGRGCQVSDMCFDSFGVLLGCVIALVGVRIIRRSKG